MGRGKIEIKKIENATNRQVTFSKRRGGLMKKANELAILCDVQLGLVIFSNSGKMFEYSNPPQSMREIIERYQRTNQTLFDEHEYQKQLCCEMSRMKHENDKIQNSLRRYMGEDLTELTMNDLNCLEEQLEIAVERVRNRKQQLLHQQLDNLRRKEHILEDQNKQLYFVLTDHQAVMDRHPAEMESRVLSDLPLLEHFGHFFPEEPGMQLQLSPQLSAMRLQPSQPNLQDANLPGRGLQLWYICFA